MTTVARFSFAAGELTISGGPGGWAMTRTWRGHPPIVDITTLNDDDVLVGLMERAIRGDRTAAEELFAHPG